MPFGLMNAPSSFQRMMDQICVDLTFVRVYLDDVGVFPMSLVAHMSHLQKLFEKMSNPNLKVKISKCNFAQPEIKLLGHVVMSSIRMVSRWTQGR